MKTSILSALVAAALVPCSAAPYVLTDLGTAGSDTAATGINNRGDVCGYVWSSNNAIPGKAYVYSKATGMFLLPIPGGHDAVANAIDWSGNSIVGYLIKSGNGNRSAFIYKMDTGVLVDLGQAGPAPALDSEAKAVAADGLAIMGYDRASPMSVSTQATRWVSWLPPHGERTGYGGYTVQANGVNNHATFVGQVKLSDSDFRPFAQKYGEFITILPTLGGFAATATAINDADQVAGWGYLPGDGKTHAFLTKVGSSTIVDLAAGSPFAAYHSQATAINSLGHVVGWFEDPGENRRAFLYQNGTMIDLNTLLPPGTDMVLTEANGINRYGQIVGRGVKNGYPHSFLLSPPLSFAIAGKKTIFAPELKRNVTIAGTGTLALSSVVYRVGNKGKFRTAQGTSRWRFTAKIPPGSSFITVIGKGPGGSTTPTKIRIRRR